MNHNIAAFSHDVDARRGDHGAAQVGEEISSHDVMMSSIHRTAQHVCALYFWRLGEDAATARGVKSFIVIDDNEVARSGSLMGITPSCLFPLFIPAGEHGRIGRPGNVGGLFSTWGGCSRCRP